MVTRGRYVKYNAVLRGFPEYASRSSYEVFQELCMSNTYTTTLHTINSAISKLAKLTPAAPCYRGVSGVLPAEFWAPNAHNVRGGVEPSFLSTTLDRETALKYAKHRDAPILFEMPMGMVDRGADLTWLSQARAPSLCFHLFSRGLPPCLLPVVSLLVYLRWTSLCFRSTRTSKRSSSRRCVASRCSALVCRTP